MATDECIVIEWMYVYDKKHENKQKEWHPATETFELFRVPSYVHLCKAPDQRE